MTLTDYMSQEKKKKEDLPASIKGLKTYIYKSEERLNTVAWNLTGTNKETEMRRKIIV